MIRIRQIKVEIDINNLKDKIVSRLKVNSNDIKDIIINKRSIDARHKPKLYYIYEVDVKVNNEDEILKRIKDKDIFKTPDDSYKFKVDKIDESKKIVIVGSGPAGLFTAYMLTSNGYKVTLIERGEKVEDRINTVNKFWQDGILNTESNVQFGEGGAGTFSDGKLNTLVKDKYGRIKKVLEIFVKCGASNEIMYDNKPHIGTDILRTVIINMRESIISNGGTILYNTCLTDIDIKDNKVVGITVNNDNYISCNTLVLALGHSARDTFKMLHNKNINMESKAFAVGARVMHNQHMIDINQYGRCDIGASSYKLTYKSSNNRGVYSFCMCPGGYVVNASSENGMTAINGMSNYKRDSGIANSAIIVTVNNKDFGTDIFSGMEFQRKLEKITYKLGNGLIPIQLYKDYKNNKVSTNFGSIMPMLKGKFTFANINEIFPKDINDAIKEGIDYFNTKIKGFNSDDTVLAAVEARTSSPIRIIRDENFESNIKGIYPIGEGAGYAGGIVSAAVDGIKAFEKIVSSEK